MTATLVLVRHATTDWNEQKLLQGRTDRPLSQAGKAEAAAWQLPSRAGLALTTLGIAALSAAVWTQQP